MDEKILQHKKQVTRRRRLAGLRATGISFGLTALCLPLCTYAQSYLPESRYSQVRSGPPAQPYEPADDSIPPMYDQPNIRRNVPLSLIPDTSPSATLPPATLAPETPPQSAPVPPAPSYPNRAISAAPDRLVSPPPSDASRQALPQAGQSSPPLPMPTYPQFKPFATIETMQGDARPANHAEAKLQKQPLPAASPDTPVDAPPAPASAPMQAGLATAPPKSAPAPKAAPKPPVKPALPDTIPEPPTVRTQRKPLDSATRQILSRIPRRFDSPPEPTKEHTDVSRYDPDIEGILSDESEAPEDEVKRHESMGVAIEVRKPAMDVNVELQQAYDALINGQTHIATQIYREILQYNSRNDDALFGLATTYHRIGELEKARPFYVKLLRLYPDHRDGLTNFLTLVAQESPEEAVEQLEDLAGQHPDFSPIFAQLGVLYHELGEQDHALNALIRAVRLEPENLAYKYNLAILYDRYGMYRDATVLYNKLLAAARTGLTLPVDPGDLQSRVIEINNLSSRR